MTNNLDLIQQSHQQIFDDIVGLADKQEHPDPDLEIKSLEQQKDEMIELLINNGFDREQIEDLKFEELQNLLKEANIDQAKYAC